MGARSLTDYFYTHNIGYSVSEEDTKKTENVIQYLLDCEISENEIMSLVLNEEYSNEYSNSFNNDSNLYDLIICNPPYFNFSVKYVDNGRMRARCNDSLPPQSLFCNVNKLLKDNSLFFLIIPFEQLEHYLEIAKQYSFAINKILNVSSVKGKSPYVSLICFKKLQFLNTSKIQDKDLNDYPQDFEYLFLENGTQKSDFWKNLTKELYIK